MTISFGSIARTALAAVVAATGAALFTGVPGAAADTPDTCRNHTAVSVTCEVWSDSMQRYIPVVVKPASTPGNDRVIQFLDGVHGGDGWSSRAMDYVADDDATIVFPSADSRSFWVDWDSTAPNGKELKYETFLTRELPAYLETEFDVPNGGRERTGVVGLSMGAYSAVNLASKHPGMYRSVLALSGFYNNQMLAGRLAVDGTAITHGEDNAGVPWDSERSRMQDNPWINVDNLTMPVHMAVATGLPDPRSSYPLRTTVDGAVIEIGSLGATAAWDLWTRLNGKDNVTITYTPVGIHAYDTWINAAFKDQKLYWRFADF
ncbi:alpha/beta hydrolase [Corynebacterium glyciniphilum]|uniref:alpha/beta hydrolase n=1 Tax=Corynebacterium glyciniphilum TaxID=1404244 RepID=UPI0011AB8106|nr:alpha/beta hydrolase-fold protein [Corynebacterium glyciniphilum]